MKLHLRSPSIGASHHLPAWCALLAPKPSNRCQHRLELSPPPHTNCNPNNPASALVNSTTYFPSLSHNPNTIEFA
jgi:hypothetical protein